jgi:alpha/beta superfamily hydrolase
MSEHVVVPGSRDVRGVLDTPDADHAVVACPPHPQMGGTRSDPRLRAVSDALRERSVGCLRIDYGPWDEGRGEVRDAVAACEWGRERFDRVGLFGYSFGGGVALLAATEARPDALSVLAPAATLGDRDTTAAIAGIDCPIQVCYGERDETVAWKAVVDAVRDRGGTLEGIGADHHFVGQRDRVGELVGEWLADRLRE